ncbi:MAG: alpha/beta fold hydrolase [Candidatus Sumerlaeota bacterium]|nr:alpha/beta fold hydrolase [Candidatus Sumerlaeota bacterium]
MSLQLYRSRSHVLIIAIGLVCAHAVWAAEPKQRKGAGSKPANTAEASKPAAGGVEQFPDGSTGRVMDFVSTGTVAIGAYLRKPAGAGPFPVVVMLHGGGPSNGYGLGRSTHSPTAEFVAAGWAVYSIDFRHETPRAGATGPVLDPIEWEDTITAVNTVRAVPGIDPKRVALLGGSHGANVVSRVASRVDASCCVLCAPAALDLTEVAKVKESGGQVYGNLVKMIHDVEVKYGAKIDEIGKDPSRYGFTSAITEADKVRSPILIINGRNDPASPIPVIDVYVNKLRAAGKEVETYLPDNGPHGFYFGPPHEIPETKVAAQRAVEFIGKHFGKETESRPTTQEK